MSDFDDLAVLRPLRVISTFVPGTTKIQAMNLAYEVVLGSGRAVGFTLDVVVDSTLQDAINGLSQQVVQQVMSAEGITSLWPVQITAEGDLEFGLPTIEGAG